MIKFTTLTTKPILPGLAELQKANFLLKEEKNFLLDIVTFIAIGGIVIVGIDIYLKAIKPTPNEPKKVGN